MNPASSMRAAPMRAVAAVVVVVAVAGCGGDDDAPVAAGGATTIADRTSNAYAQPAPNLDPAGLARHRAGDAAFSAVFVRGPAPVNGGLGPQFNHNACEACHVRDGRGLPSLGVTGSQALVRISLADGTPAVPGGAVPVPGLGTQLQDHAVFGVEPEIRLALAWQPVDGSYADGTPYQLRAPLVTATHPDGTAIGDEVLRSFRQAPPVFGLGLLEAIPDAALEAAADPDDRDGDGISGKVNRVWDVAAGATRVGRFGHKASMPSLGQQAAAAYANDMGVDNRLFGETPELADGTLDDATFYTATLAVPARRDVDVSAGERLFEAYGCAACHTPVQVTGDHPIAALANQAFAPYTDLLLHDLGAGLADGRADFLADGREWRTPPLWGLGLVPTVLPGAGYLHDGRARTVAEAILWHGGEAAPARRHFVEATAADRAALEAFLAAL